MGIIRDVFKVSAVITVLISGVAVYQTDAFAGATQASDAKAADLKPLKHSEVCMVTNNYMGKEQIPVKIGGKTYYGCCKDCAGKLKKNRDVRFSKDPVSGNEVDKATAIILADAVGKAMYFESRETAVKYMASKNADIKR